MTIEEAAIAEPVPYSDSTYAFNKFDFARHRYEGLNLALELFKLPHLQGQANAQNIITVADLFTQYISQELNVVPSQPEDIAKS